MPGYHVSMFRHVLILAGLWLFCLGSFGQSATPPAQEESLPLWEYGVGLGYVRFWHYPASNQTREWVLPFPTFQYRGEVLRADDREGARAYLLREHHWSLEMGGGFLPALKSQDDQNRQGMEDLPWRFQLGPQIVSHFHPEFQVKWGVYQVITTPNVKTFQTKGVLSELQFIWHLNERIRETRLFGTARVRSHLALTLTGTSKDFNQLYYGVGPQDVTPTRPAYEARSGFLSYDLLFFHAVSWRPYSIYFGADEEFFDRSANRESPLHKSDRNLNLFAGLTYTLGESEKRAVPESKAEGALEKIRERIPYLQQ